MQSYSVACPTIAETVPLLRRAAAHQGRAKVGRIPARQIHTGYGVRLLPPAWVVTLSIP